MKQLPEGNLYISYQTGDGFRTLLGNTLLTETDIVITSKCLVQLYDSSKATVTTIHSLHKLKMVNYGRMVFDIHLPSPQSKQLNRVCELIKGMSVVVLHGLANAGQATSLNLILKATGRPGLLLTRYQGGQLCPR